MSASLISTHSANRNLKHANVIALIDVISPMLATNSMATAEFTESLRKRRRMKDVGDLYLVFDFVDTVILFILVLTKPLVVIT
jgi:hypothetical protein